MFGRRLAAAGGVRALAREMGVSAAEVSRVATGARGIGPIIAAKMNLRAVTMYESVPPRDLHPTKSTRLPRGRPPKVP